MCSFSDSSDRDRFIHKEGYLGFECTSAKRGLLLFMKKTRAPLVTPDYGMKTNTRFLLELAKLKLNFPESSGN